jgi:hypothetical protein
MTNVSDESVMDMEKRKYYIQSYDFIMMGFLIDENEFEVSPAVNRVLQVVEFDTTRRTRNKITNEIKNSDTFFINFTSTQTKRNQTFDITCDVKLTNLVNIDSFDVFINGDYYGSDLFEIQVNTKDVITFEIQKTNTNNPSTIELQLGVI